MEVNKNAVEKNRIAILHIMSEYDGRLTDTQLLSVCTELSLMDYFDLNNSLHELSAAGLLERTESVNGVFYERTAMGETTLEFFKKELPFSLREQLSAYMKANRDRLTEETRIHAEYIKLSEHQYRVMMKLLENDLPIFELSFMTDSREEAERFIRSWRKNAMEVYHNTFSMLIRED